MPNFSSLARLEVPEKFVWGGMGWFAQSFSCQTQPLCCVVLCWGWGFDNTLSLISRFRPRNQKRRGESMRSCLVSILIARTNLSWFLGSTRVLLMFQERFAMIRRGKLLWIKTIYCEGWPDQGGARQAAQERVGGEPLEVHREAGLHGGAAHHLSHGPAALPGVRGHHSQPSQL